LFLLSMLLLLLLLLRLFLLLIAARWPNRSLGKYRERNESWN
jgi:hypothetical protein